MMQTVAGDLYRQSLHVAWGIEYVKLMIINLTISSSILARPSAKVASLLLIDEYDASCGGSQCYSVKMSWKPWHYRRHSRVSDAFSVDAEK